LWPADILHFYGLYIPICALIITKPSIRLWIIVALIVIIYPLALMIIDYEEGWNWKTTEYVGFWTLKGFFRNLFINGFHPVIPWVAFAISGIWLGRQNLKNSNIRNHILWISGWVFVTVQVISQLLIRTMKSFIEVSSEDAVAIFGTYPMPPLPLYMISGISLSFFIIILCVILTEKFSNSKVLDILATTGQMAFTHYVAHVVIGILAVYVLFGTHSLSPQFTIWYAIGFCLLSVLFSWIWRIKFKKGPMSLFMRLITK